MHHRIAFVLLFAIVVFITASTRAPKANTPAELPGRIVDVSAGEFFFAAPDTIPEGVTTLRLRQTGMVVERIAKGLAGRELVRDKDDDTRGAHMLWVVRLVPGKTVGDLVRAAQSGERTTSWAHQLGGPSFALPPRTSNITLDLTPGNYALVCYVGSARENKARYHLLNGMVRPLTVVKGSMLRANLPFGDVIARIGEGGSIRFSRDVTRGTHIIRVENETDSEYEFKIHRMPADLRAEDFLRQPSSAGPGISWGGLASVPPHTTVLTTIDFEKGEYVAGTWPRIRHKMSQVIVVR
jgi:hypothetical protein